MRDLAEASGRRSEPDLLTIQIADGAGIMVRTAQSVVARKGDTMVLLQGEIINAYGQVSREAVLKAMRTECPALAPIIACQWQGDPSIRLPPGRDEVEIMEHIVMARQVLEQSGFLYPAHANTPPCKSAMQQSFPDGCTCYN